MGFGVFMVGFSSIFTGLNFVTTVHKMRAPGLTWFKLPLFIWGIYATSILQVLATPVLGDHAAAARVERLYGMGFFDPMLGGDPVMFQHFFWFYSHPAVYIMILPAMAIISDVVSVHVAQAAVRLQADRVQLALDRDHQLPRVGPPHVHERPVGVRDDDLLLPDLLRGHPDRDQGVQLGRHDLEGLDRAVSAPMFYALAFIDHLHHRRPDRDHARRRRPDLHLHDTYYRRRALPLRDDGLDRARLLRRRPPLVAADVGPDVLRVLGADRRGHHLLRVQPDVLPAVHHGQPGHAAPLRDLPRPLGGLPHTLDDRRDARSASASR
jgi:hypothetical protein